MIKKPAIVWLPTAVVIELGSISSQIAFRSRFSNVTISNSSFSKA